MDPCFCRRLQLVQLVAVDCHQTCIEWNSACDKINIDLCTATDVGIYGLFASLSCYHSMLFLVGLHCGPVVDFYIPTFLHPSFDFDRNLLVVNHNYRQPKIAIACARYNYAALA